jgi:gamma-glutamylcyclotransferase (GGCT)/AIG2-like uncharacterized protein YtfP
MGKSSRNVNRGVAMRTTIPALLVVTLLASTALADLSEAVDGARSAMTIRISLLDGLSDQTKPEKKEGKKLGKALDKLTDYLGTDDTGDLKRTLKAVKLLTGSKTVDAALLAALEEILDELDEMAGELRAEAVALLVTVIEAKKHKVQRSIDKGDAKRLLAHGDWAEKPGSCVKNLIKAIGHFREAVAKAEKHQEEQPPPSADVSIHGTHLFNNTNHGIKITDFTYGVNGTLGGKPYSFGGKASDTHPQLVPISVASKASYNVLPVLTLLVNSDPTRPKLIPGDFVTTTYTIHTTAGDISSP